MNDNKHPVEIIAEACGGTITDGGILPDGSGFAVMSMPLRKDHWIYGDGQFNVPPMPFRMGSSDQVVVEVIRDVAVPLVKPTIQELEKLLSSTPQGSVQISPLGGITVGLTREEFAQKIRAAGRYAVQCATMNGREMDFDPDALLQNLVVGMLGYWTEDGLSDDEWANPTSETGARYTTKRQAPLETEVGPTENSAL